MNVTLDLIDELCSRALTGVVARALLIIAFFS